MPGKKGRKRTEKQRRLFGAALRAGKAKPSYVPSSMWRMPVSDLSADAKKPKRKRKKMS